MTYSNRFFMALLAVVAVFLIGCQSTPSTPSSQPQAAAATSLHDITADCIVSYFSQDQAPYITEQQYRLNVESGKLQITANEPDGTYAFTLTKEQFSASDKTLTPFLSDLPGGFVSQPLATLVFYSFAASSALLETESLESGEDLKLEGRWYQPLQATWPQQNSRVILLKNSDNNRTDTVGITEFDTEAAISDDPMAPPLPVMSRWLAKSYNLRYNKQLDRLLPRKIDLFDIQKGIASKKLMVQIELKTIRQEKRSAELEQ